MEVVTLIEWFLKWEFTGGDLICWPCCGFKDWGLIFGHWYPGWYFAI